MMSDPLDQVIEGLTLLLLYLRAREEKILTETIRRSWKGYLFEALNILADKGYIFTSRRSRLCILLKRAFLVFVQYKPDYQE